MPEDIESDMPPTSSRIQDRLAGLKKIRKKALVIFATAGFPAGDSTVEVVMSLAEAGVDIIELGMPFSDPIADGPVIQASSASALRNGITLEGILGAVSKVRTTSQIPLVLMGYLNPIMAYGTEKFFRDAAGAGVDGVILPEIPLEEAPRFSDLLRNNGLAQILLVTPTTPDGRMQAIDSASSGFVYCVSSTGVTGSGKYIGLAQYVRRAKGAMRHNPLLVGFGIQSVEDARAASEHADGVIVGSAYLQRLQKGQSVMEAASWVRTLRAGLDSPRGGES
jgi:tryptophan synthase alpha chain